MPLALCDVEMLNCTKVREEVSGELLNKQGMCRLRLYIGFNSHLSLCETLSVGDSARLAKPSALALSSDNDCDLLSNYWNVVTDVGKHAVARHGENAIVPHVTVECSQVARGMRLNTAWLLEGSRRRAVRERGRTSTEQRSCCKGQRSLDGQCNIVVLEISGSSNIVMKCNPKANKLKYLLPAVCPLQRCANKLNWSEGLQRDDVLIINKKALSYSQTECIITLSFDKMIMTSN
ncbi:hypothetical protein PR048_031977 [Dryococelus australis]|uniref:Uncharacterized protein n=1 Tax=Dryococelus australis TaxID=614101 RepID=A0ABQ9G9Q4_9NEOP|nr:hypothetical protein PR048_031977 [Dryococelus australis]